MVIALIAVLVLLAVACGAIAYRAMRPRSTPVVPAIPPDEEEIWLLGRRISYADARELARDLHQQVTVSTSTGSPGPDEPELRIGRLTAMGGDTEHSVLTP